MTLSPHLLRLRNLAREPTLHFVAIAAGLFVMQAAFSSRHVVEIDRGLLDLQLQIEEATLGRPLTGDERRRLEEDFVTKRVLVAEARALGLDDDERVHDILAEKMRHVLSADVIQPTDDELRAYYQGHIARYTRAGGATIDEVVVSGPPAALQAVEEGLRGDAPVDTLDGAIIVSRTVLRDITGDDLTALFGVETTRNILAAPAGRWVGPHETARGRHWLRVRERSEGSAVAFEDMRERVRADWVASEEERRLADRVATLRREYTVVFTGETE